MNTVLSLKSSPFSARSSSQKKEIVRLGPNRPILTYVTKCRRKFYPHWYEKYTWLTGCSDTQKVYCFPCILFSPATKEKAWTNTGVSDWRHFIEKVQRHSKSATHLESALKLGFFGKADIAEHLSEAYRQSVAKHNALVDQNRHVLSRVIDCIKFCGAFELALRGHDESEESSNPGVFRGLVNLMASIDSSVKEFLGGSRVFKGTSKAIQNELLEIMYGIVQSEIKKEIREAEFLAVISDDTTDVASLSVNVVLRYVLKAKVYERFWAFSRLKVGDSASISEKVTHCLQEVLPSDSDKQKLVAQCYDGASVMSGKHQGVQNIVRRQYPMANFVHCYAHQLNLVVQQALNSIPVIRIFFANLSGFSSFFSNSAKRMSVLEDCIGKRIPKISATRWSFSV